MDNAKSFGNKVKKKQNKKITCLEDSAGQRNLSMRWTGSLREKKFKIHRYDMGLISETYKELV